MSKSSNGFFGSVGKIAVLYMVMNGCNGLVEKHERNEVIDRYNTKINHIKRQEENGNVFRGKVHVEATAIDTAKDFFSPCAKLKTNIGDIITTGYEHALAEQALKDKNPDNDSVFVQAMREMKGEPFKTFETPRTPYPSHFAR